MIAGFKVFSGIKVPLFLTLSGSAGGKTDKKDSKLLHSFNSSCLLTTHNLREMRRTVKMI